jgi:hypothetical protein
LPTHPPCATNGGPEPNSTEFNKKPSAATNTGAAYTRNSRSRTRAHDSTKPLAAALDESDRSAFCAQKR